MFSLPKRLRLRLKITVFSLPNRLKRLRLKIKIKNNVLSLPKRLRLNRLKCSRYQKD